MAWTTQDVAHSFALWWRDAGLHSLTTEAPHGWLGGDEPAPVRRAPEMPAPQVDMAAASAPVARRLVPSAPGAMPADIAAFRAWLAHDPGQPEAMWSGPACLPPVQIGARLLILVDMPDAGVDDPDMPIAPPVRRFLAAMLGTIGMPADEAAIAPLAFRRAPGGLLDDAMLAQLAGRMRHYLGLARPRAALILGDRTSRALIAAAHDAGRGSLTQIAYEGGMLPVAALPSPDHLMRRPSAKAASWQSLRLLTSVIAA